MIPQLFQGDAGDLGKEFFQGGKPQAAAAIFQQFVNLLTQAGVQRRGRPPARGGVEAMMFLTEAVPVVKRLPGDADLLGHLARGDAVACGPAAQGHGVGADLPFQTAQGFLAVGSAGMRLVPGNRAG